MAGMKGKSGPPRQHKRLQARAGAYSETAGEHSKTETSHRIIFVNREYKRIMKTHLANRKYGLPGDSRPVYWEELGV